MKNIYRHYFVEKFNEKNKEQLSLSRKSDYLRLTNLLKVELNSDAIRALGDEIDRAKIISDESIGRDIVSIDSLVSFLDIDFEKEITVQLVMPTDVSIENSKISVLSAIGSALIGLKKNGYIEWPMPTGKVRRMCITDVVHQAIAQANKKAPFQDRRHAYST